MSSVNLNTSLSFLTDSLPKSQHKKSNSVISAKYFTFTAPAAVFQTATIEELISRRHQECSATRKMIIGQFTHFTKLLDGYRDIMKHYQVRTYTQPIMTKEGQIIDDFTPFKLKEIIQKVMKAEERAILGLEIIEESGHFITNISNNQLELFKLDYKIEDGGEGGVFSATALHLGEKVALKRSHPGPIMVDAVRDDYQILCDINSGGPVWGLSEKPSSCFYLHEAQRQVHCGKKYVTDYYTLTTEHFEQGKALHLHTMLYDFHQVLFGLKYLAEHKIFNADIKNENIYIENLEEGRYLTRLGDFGASFNRNTFSHSHFLEKTIRSTPQYILKSEVNLLIILQAKGQEKEFYEAGFKADVFAMGSALFSAFTSDDPYEVGEDKYPDPAQPSLVSTAHIPEEILAIIKGMIEFDPKKRLTAAQAFAAWDQYIVKNCPALHDEILKMMAKHSSCALERNTKKIPAMSNESKVLKDPPPPLHIASDHDTAIIRVLDE